MFWRKKKTEETEAKIILGMVLLNEALHFSIDDFFKDYRAHYDDEIGEVTGNDTIATFNIDREMIAISLMPVPVPWGDIEGTAKYAYNWETATDDLKDHKAHLIISSLKGGNDPVYRFGIFTQVICSLLRTTNAIGVYKGNQSLLIDKNAYLNLAALMSEDQYPLNLWVYFGFVRHGEKNSGYTYGLVEFGKKEMEILNSDKSLGDVMGFLFNMSHYVLQFGVEFKEGQTCGLSAEEKIRISYSKGKLVEGYSFKLAY